MRSSILYELVFINNDNNNSSNNSNNGNHNNDSIDINIKFYSIIDSSVYLSPQKITGYGVLTNTSTTYNTPSSSNKEFIITSLDKGIAVIKKKISSNNLVDEWELVGVVTTYKNNINSETSPLSVNDFVINQSTIYVVVPNFGLKVFITSYNVNNQQTSRNLLTVKNCFEEAVAYIHHPFMRKIDFYYNYLTQKSFIGISINTRYPLSEFFIELLIEREYSPQVNKIFYNEDSVDSDNFLTGEHFSYILNKDNQNIIIFRRGLLNPLTELTYVIHIGSELRTNKDFHSKAVLLYDTILNKTGISLFTKDNYMVNINDFVFKDEQLKCKFNQPGTYLLNFMAQSEMCEGVGNEVDHYCYITIISQLLVVEKVTPYLQTLRIILGVMSSFILICIIIVIISFTKCFRNKCGKKLNKALDEIEMKENEAKEKGRNANNEKIENEFDISPTRKIKTYDYSSPKGIEDNVKDISKDITSERKAIVALDLQSNRSNQ